MKDFLKENPKQKQLFKSYHCSTCKQTKPCGTLDKKKNYCCPCYRKILEELEWDRLLVDSAQELLNGYRQRKVICYCLESEKTRVSSDYYTWCEKCEGRIKVASKKRVVKNRNDVRFWGIESEWKVLCLECIGKRFYKEMVRWQRKKFREYRRRGYV